jgi:Tfp pilus assembly protein PilZ
MVRGQANAADAESYEITFEGLTDFLGEYEANIRHGGMFVPWDSPPPIDTRVHLILKLPLDFVPLPVDAVVVFSSPGGVGLQLVALDANRRELLDACAAACRTKAGEREAMAGPPTHLLSFPSVEAFQREYETNIRHGGVFVPWQPPPPVHTAVRLRLELPFDLEPVELEAQVVFASPAGAGLQLSGLDAAKRALLDSCLRRCQERQEAAGTAERPAGSSSDAPTSMRHGSASPLETPAAFPVAPPAAIPLEAAALPVAPSPAIPAAPSAASAGSSTAAATGGITSEPPRSRPAPSGPSWEGTLSDTSVPELLSTLAQRKANGRLLLQGDTSAELYFYQGQIIRVIEQPLRNEHLLGEMLVRAGQIRSIERDLALAQAREQELPLGQALIKRNSLTTQALAQALSKQQQSRVYEQTRRLEGRFSFTDYVRPPKGPPLPAVHPARVLFRGKVDEYRNRLPHEVEAAESGYSELFLFRADHAPENMGEVGLNAEEQRFWNQVVTGGYYLKEVYPLSNLSRRQTHAVVFALLELGLLVFRRDMDPRKKEQKLREALRRKVSRMEKDTLFNVLELHWMATDSDVVEGYQRVRAAYDCSSIPIEVAEDVRTMSATILKRAEEAMAALRTHEQRRKYRESFLEPSQIHFSADLLLQQGDMSLYRGDLKDAEHRFTHALELEPANKEIRAKLEEVRARKSGGFVPSRAPAPEE